VYVLGTGWIERGCGRGKGKSLKKYLGQQVKVSYTLVKYIDIKEYIDCSLVWPASLVMLE
jgi:hypothetical protein